MSVKILKHNLASIKEAEIKSVLRRYRESEVSYGDSGSQYSLNNSW